MKGGKEEWREGGGGEKEGTRVGAWKWIDFIDKLEMRFYQILYLKFLVKNSLQGECAATAKRL